MNQTLQLIASNVSLSEGIPLIVKLQSETSWSQYALSFGLGLIGSIFVLIYLWSTTIQPLFYSFLVNIKLRDLYKRSGKDILIIKHTEGGLFSQSMIDQKTLNEVASAFDKANGKDIDLILLTPGGSIFSTVYIANMIKAYPGTVRAVIPMYAMSGGTLLSLSCDEILMGETACLGPVDPQLGNLFKFGSAKSWDYITKFKGKKAEDSTISLALTGQQYTKSIQEYLSNLIEDKIPLEKRQNFIEHLTLGDIEHSALITRDKLSLLGLDTQLLDNKVRNIMVAVLTSKIKDGVHYIKTK